MCIYASTKPHTESISLSYWNIHGSNSKIIGNKLTDVEFLEKISGNHIVGLAELHVDKEVYLPGYKLLKQKIRKKFHKGPKIGGGLAIFVKEKFEHLVQVIPNKNEDSIWIKIKKEFCGETEDIYIGTFYVSPTKNEKDSKIDFFTVLNEEINYYKNKGIVLVQGDLNARTGSEKDFIEYDKFDETFGIENYNNQHLRNSEDQIINTRGKELLDLCKLNDFLIVNGRSIGDLFGKFTSHQWNGSSVSDYLLSP